MAVDLIFTSEVEWDISDAYEWYEEQRVGLGEEFLTSVDACVKQILRNPTMYARVHEEYRRALTRRFPYAIFYEVVDETVSIYAILHAAREPNKWRRRLSR
jgi:plasmid stabilization system protein ParE